MCGCVRASLVESGGEERWDSGKLQRGRVLENWVGGRGGGVCLSFFLFLLDLVASLSPSLCLFHSASLTVVHRILHCKFTAPLWETSRWESWDGAYRKEGSAGCRGKHVMVEPCCFPEEERPSVFNLFSCWPLSTRTAHFRELLSLIRH